MTETDEPTASKGVHGATIDRAAVYEELAELAQIIPGIHRDLFCYRWGLNGHSHHLQKDAIARFELTKTAVETRLEWCLWSVAREAHRRRLPAIRGLLGGDQDAWATHAWAHSDRWEHSSSQASETALLLAVGGMDVAEARARAAEHACEIGALRSCAEAKVPSAEQRLEDTAAAVEKILAHVIWPDSVRSVDDLSAFSIKRELQVWSRGRNGYFHSSKLNRPIQFESTLELSTLKHLEHDSRIRDFVVQPLTIAYSLDGCAHSYTPDVAVQLDDGRALIMEIKPPKGLGQFDHWMRWASLERHCQQQGYGLYVGSPDRSLIDHCQLTPDVDAEELIRSEVARGPVTSCTYEAIRSLVGYEQLGLTATAELLDWRSTRNTLRRARGRDKAEAARLWALVDRRAERR